MTRPHLLLVDDDEEIRTQMKWALTSDYEITAAGDRASAVQAFKANRPSIVLLDLGLPPHPGTPEEGLATLAELLGIDPLAKVIIISGQSEKAIAMRAVGGGAYDFINKPVDTDELRLILKRCLHLADLEREYRAMQLQHPPNTVAGMVGNSARMLAVFDAVRKVAPSDAPVLVLGESGTGKEMIARAIHRGSPRKDGPFVAINCGAIPEALLESELFGHEKGAFTGAHMQRKGRVELAHGGTLFLDEIGEIPPTLQVKLLRFLQEQTIERVGGRQEIEIDARVVAATHVDLKKAMAEGRFREDLYYRLAVIQVQLPPLRDREDDVRLLAQAFLHQFSAENKKSDLTFAPDAVRALLRHSWPGNVRELQNRVRRAVVMGEGRRLSAADLDLAHPAHNASMTLKEARESLEREMIEHALRRHSGRIAPAAAELGVSRPTLYDLMEKLGFQKPSGDGD